MTTKPPSRDVSRKDYLTWFRESGYDEGLALDGLVSLSMWKAFQAGYEATTGDGEPTEAMCDKARNFLLGMEIGLKTYEHMIVHLERCGDKIPAWMKKEGHLTKWDKADCIYRLMTQPPEQL